MNDELTQLQTRFDRLNLLYQVGNVIHSTLDPQEALQLIVDQAVRLMRASSGSTVLINPNTTSLEIHAAAGLPANATDLKLRVGEGITGWVARTGKPARVGDVTQDPRYVMLRPEVRSELAVPLEVNDEVRGVLNVDSDRVDAFNAADQELLEALAVQASRVIHNTWVYEQLRLKAQLFESLAGVSQTINSTLNLDDALGVITREACVLMRAKVGALMLLDESREWLDLRASFGASDAYINRPRLSVEESLHGIVVRRKKPLQVENVQVSSRYQNVEVARREGLVALLSVPLLYGGQAIGTLSVYTGQPYSFSNEEIRILSALAELSAIAIEKARLYERVMDVEEQLRQNEKLSALGLLAAEVAIINEINAAHPFIEGNGRVQRIWLANVAEKAGYEFSIRPEDRDPWYAASRIGFEHNDRGPMMALLLSRIQSLDDATRSEHGERACQFLALSREEGLASDDASFKAAWLNIEKVEAVARSALPFDDEGQQRIVDKAREQLADQIRAGASIAELNKEQAWRNTLGKEPPVDTGGAAPIA